MYGDLNGDTKVNATDALIVLQAAVGKISLSEGDQKLADVDGSGDVMATDALLILQKAVGKIDRFPVEQTEKKVTWLESASGIVSETEPYIPAEGEIKTLYQSNVGYSGSYAVETDCVLTYVYSKRRGGNLTSWVQASGKIYDKTMKVGLMIPANRDDAEFLKANPDRGMKDVQTTADGTYRKHSAFGDDIVYYMVPTEAYIQYKWEVIDSWLTEDCKVVAIEEPEIWNNAGYSEGFKEEWKKYYGTDWKDQTSSAQAMYDSQRLKAYLFKREIEFLSQKIKEKYPDVTVLLATHCTVDYSSHGISTGMSMYGSIPTVDGFIGQTWSDGVTRSIPYAGTQSVNTFAVSMYEYASYKAFLPEGKSLYLLQDPASDAGFPRMSARTTTKPPLWPLLCSRTPTISRIQYGLSARFCLWVRIIRVSSSVSIKCIIPSPDSAARFIPEPKEYTSACRIQPAGTSAIVLQHQAGVLRQSTVYRPHLYTRGNSGKYPLS